MKKKILSILLTLCMVLTLMPAMPVRVSADDHTDHCICGANHTIVGDHNAEKKPSNEGKSWTAWNTDNSLPDSAGYYYLTTNVTLDSSWSPANGTVLCLNRHTITGPGDAEGAEGGFIKVNPTYTFTLTDCQENEGKIEITNDKTCIYSRGTFNMYGGSIEHTNSATGTGVWVRTDKTFNMYGGKITNNSLCGVCNFGTFHMYGGKITGNSAADKGGGVNNFESFYMSGGSITQNTACYGGGVYNYGTFEMSGGNITRNTANTESGQGGGVYIYNSATFTMSGGSITVNDAFEKGGGVYNDGTFNVSSTAVVQNNTRRLYPAANNVYLPNSKVITISNALNSGTSIGVTVENPPAEGNSVNITDGAGDGNEQYFFSDDDIYETYCDSNIIKIKLKETCSHSGSKVNGQAETCTEDGWTDYYQCSECDKYFSDSACTNSISDLDTWKTGGGKINKLGHNWTYSANGATLTASCSRKATCHEEDQTLTITATTVEHSGSPYSGASISNTSAWTGANLVVPTIMYEGTDGTSYGSSATAPTDAGRYKATITCGSATAAAPFAITGAEHTLKVESDENGIAGIQSTAVTGSAIACYTEVTLTATPNSGYRFKQWVVSGGAITITNNKFVMPDSDVTVKAEFEKISSGGSNPGGGINSGGSTGGGISSGGNTAEVTTSKDSESNTAITTSPAEVKVENGIASATVKTVNMTEAIRQAADNKSAEIVFTISEAESGNADTIRLTISKSDAQHIMDKTAANLVVTTPAGDVILSQETMGEVLQAAEGTDFTVEVAKVTNPTEVQKQAAGDNGYIVGVTIASQNKAITTFGGKTLTIRLEIPAELLNNEVAAIHIADDGKTEKMPGKVVTEGAKQYYEFTTTHLSTFALIEEKEDSQPEEETPTVSYPEKGTLLTDSKTQMVYKVTKAGLTGGTVQFVKTKNTKAKTITIPATVTFDGITYKVTSIAAGALKNNKVITKVVIGKNVTVIGKGAFSGCTKLKSVAIGKGVVSINSKAFYNCTSLTTLTIPASVTKIWDYAFKGCSKLSSLKINSTKLTTKTLSGLSMKGISTKTVIKVPKSKVKAYKTLFVKKGLSKKVTVKSL